MRIFCIEYYLLGHFSEGEWGEGRDGNGNYLKSMLIFRVTSAGVSVGLEAVVSLLSPWLADYARPTSFPPAFESDKVVKSSRGAAPSDMPLSIRIPLRVLRSPWK